jgi:NADPH:quinone reductase-like Zn-dependent oxidoreductase
LRRTLVRVRAASINPVDYKIRRSGGWAELPMPAAGGTTGKLVITI